MYVLKGEEERAEGKVRKAARMGTGKLGRREKGN